MPDHELLVSLTSDIVAAHVSNNPIAIGEVSALIGSTYGALAGLGKVPAAAAPEKPKGAVSLRASIKPDYLVSMIDGNHYKMLRRHLSQNGYTPESYRETFGLPNDYPLVAPNYAARRRELALQIGLGRKPAVPAGKPAGRRGRPKAPQV